MNESTRMERLVIAIVGSGVVPRSDDGQYARDVASIAAKLDGEIAKLDRGCFVQNRMPERTHLEGLVVQDLG